MSKHSELADRAMRALSAWAKNAEHNFVPLPGNPDSGFYGSGYNAWGVQTNQKYLAAMACLAANADSADGIDAEWALDRAQAALRFSLDSHHSGKGACSDGAKWGHTWISSLGIERMMHGVYAVWNRLADTERESLCRVLTSEANWLLTDYCRGKSRGIKAGQWASSGENDPESNLWNGAALWRAAAIYPEHARAADWREAAHLFLINAISVPSDAADETIVAGKPVRERHVGANFFENFALDHHGYLNAGYMVICLSNAAMLHFDLAIKNLPRPETLDFHADGLWRALRRMIFSDGRLFRIGGDTRVRYAYCQEYLLPALLYAADRLAAPHALGLAAAQMDMVETEQAHNADGSFYGKRLRNMAVFNPYYYTRLESDRACALSQLVTYLPLVQTPPKAELGFEDSVRGAWSEPEHAAALHRSPKRLVSFAWRAFGLAQGLCLPPGDGHLCDWERNMAAQIEFAPASPGADGAPMPRRLVDGQVKTFEGGFLAHGAVIEGAKAAFEEGWQAEELLLHRIVFAALPDECAAVCIEQCVVLDKRAYVGAIKGLHFNLANDLFNGFERKIFSEHGQRLLRAPAPDDGRVLRLPGAKWLNCENRVGIVGLYGADEFAVCRSPEQRAGAKKSLFVEEICWPYLALAGWVEPGRIVLDAACAVLSGAGAEQTRRIAASPETRRIGLCQPGLRAVSVLGADNKRYIIAANFGAEPCSVSCAALAPHARLVQDLVARRTVNGDGAIEIPPGSAAVLCAAS